MVRNFTSFHKGEDIGLGKSWQLNQSSPIKKTHLQINIGFETFITLPDYWDLLYPVL